MEIQVHHMENNNKSTIDNYDVDDNEKKFECAFCHRKYSTPIERAECEKRCYQKRKQIDNIRKEAVHQQMANADTQRISKEYDQFIADIKHHVDTYGEMVKIHGHYFSRDPDFDLSLLELKNMSPFWF